MGPPRFELESEDPQSPRMPGYPTIPLHYLVSLPDILGFPYGFGKRGVRPAVLPLDSAGSAACII